jgi:small subunit ribosomal protein S2
LDPGASKEVDPQHAPEVNQIGGVYVAVVSMKQLLEAGVHFGHRTRRWNPKMKPYIYGERKGIYIVDLQKTLKLIEEAYEHVRNRAQEGATFLFVGTKRQAQQIVEEEAKRSGSFYVNSRWLGGLLTNFSTIKRRIEALKNFEEMETSGKLAALPKKEQSMINKRLEKLRKNLNGVKEMHKLPDVIFIVDPKQEEIAVSEANKLGIKVVGIADTNCDPDVIDFIIPGNDDAIRAIQLIVHTMADAILEGREGLDASVLASKSSEATTVKGPEELPDIGETEELEETDE